jgi:hypothetical protein
MSQKVTNVAKGMIDTTLFEYNAIKKRKTFQWDNHCHYHTKFQCRRQINGANWLKWELFAMSL